MPPTGGRRLLDSKASNACEFIDEMFTAARAASSMTTVTASGLLAFLNIHIVRELGLEASAKRRDRICRNQRDDWDAGCRKRNVEGVYVCWLVQKRAVWGTVYRIKPQC